MSLKGDFYTTASPEDFWIEVINSPIYRSSQSRNNPKFLSRRVLRKSDFKIATDPFTEDRLILPDYTRGLSFADSIETLRNKKVRGKFIFRGQYAWKISIGALPHGLVVNYQDKTHPLINVRIPMKESEFIEKINHLIQTGRYTCTNIKV